MTETAPATPATGGDDDLLSTNQAAAKLGISRRLFYELILQGEIETIRIPTRNGRVGEHRIEPAELQRFKDEHRQQRTA